MGSAVDDLDRDLSDMLNHIESAVDDPDRPIC